jgi:hypothetical protein
MAPSGGRSAYHTRCQSTPLWPRAVPLQCVHHTEPNKSKRHQARNDVQHNTIKSLRPIAHLKPLSALHTVAQDQARKMRCARLLGLRSGAAEIRPRTALALSIECVIPNCGRLNPLPGGTRRGAGKTPRSSVFLMADVRFGQQRSSRSTWGRCPRAIGPMPKIYGPTPRWLFEKPFVGVLT